MKIKVTSSTKTIQYKANKLQWLAFKKMVTDNTIMKPAQ